MLSRQMTHVYFSHFLLQGKVPEHFTSGRDDAEALVSPHHHWACLCSLRHCGVHCLFPSGNFNFHPTTQAQGPITYSCQGETISIPVCLHKMTQKQHALDHWVYYSLENDSSAYFSQKRRLSWTGTDSPTPSPVLLKCPRVTSEEKKVKQGQRDSPPPRPSVSDANQNSLDVARGSQLSERAKGQDSGSEELGKPSQYKAGQSSEPSLTWVHVAPILSPRKACTSHESTSAAGSGESQPVTGVLSPSRRGSPATQDSAVSSTTPYKHTKNLKKPIRCQSQHAAGREGDGETNSACQGQSQSPHVTLKPLPKVCPNPLETWCIVERRAGSLTLFHHRAEGCSEREVGSVGKPVIIDAFREDKWEMRQPLITTTTTTVIFEQQDVAYLS